MRRVTVIAIVGAALLSAAIGLAQLIDSRTYGTRPYTPAEAEILAEISVLNEELGAAQLRGDEESCRRIEARKRELWARRRPVASSRN